MNKQLTLSILKTVERFRVFLTTAIIVSTIGALCVIIASAAMQKLMVGPPFLFWALIFYGIKLVMKPIPTVEEYEGHDG